MSRTDSWRLIKKKSIKGTELVTSEICFLSSEEFKKIDIMLDANEDDDAEPQIRGNFCYKCKIVEPAGSKFSQCASCKIARYCSKDCQVVDWRSSHKVYRTQLISQAECAKLKDNRDIDPSLDRKFKKWRGKNAVYLLPIASSIIKRDRLESHVAVLRLKELDQGFRVVLAEEVSIEILSNDQKQSISDVMISARTTLPALMCFVAMYIVEEADASCASAVLFDGICMNEDSLVDSEKYEPIAFQEMLIERMNKNL
jgi:hypothetical protein